MLAEPYTRNSDGSSSTTAEDETEIFEQALTKEEWNEEPLKCGGREKVILKPTL